MNFVVFHQAYKNSKSTEFVIKSFRKFHPNVPYVLWSDNGDDYSHLVEKYNIDYIFSDYRVGLFMYDGKRQIFNFFDRIKKSCEMYPDKPYVMYMEDDVLIKGKIKIPDGVDFCGWDDIGNNLVHRFGIEKFQEICKKYNVNPNFDYYTTAGGAILSSDIFLNKFDIIERYINEDYEEIQKACKEIHPGFESIFYCDIEIMMLHLICDKKYSVWEQICDLTKNPNWNSDQYCVVHAFKEHYN
jgi:hypothetical protein